VGVNDIRGLYFPPPAPPAGRGVFVQALNNLAWLNAHDHSKEGGFPYGLSAKSPNPDAFTHLLSGGENTEHYVDLYAVSSVCQYRFFLPVRALTKQPPVSIFPLNILRRQAGRNRQCFPFI
jgi:hypothetical protein